MRHTTCNEGRSDATYGSPRVSSARWLVALLLIACSTAPLSAQPITPAPLPDPGIPGYQFPEAEATVLNWILNNDQQQIDLHMWGLWTQVTSLTGQMFEGQNLRVFETWMTPSDIRSGFSSPGHPRPLDTPSQLGSQQTSVLGMVKDNPSAANFLATEQLFSTVTLDDLIAASAPQIPVFPNDAVTTKPVFIPLGQATGGPYKLPVWPGPPGTPQEWGPPTAANPTWPDVVWVDTTIPGDGTGDGTVATDGPGLLPTPTTTYGLGRFINFTDSNGVVHILVAMHLTTRETTRWTWQTFWWTPTPDNPKSPSSSAHAANRPAQLTGAPRHYAGCNAYKMVSPAQPITGGSASGTTPHLCYNPWLEAGFGPCDLRVPNNAAPSYGVFTNCMSCHAQARYPKPAPLTPTPTCPAPVSQYESRAEFYTSAQYIDIGPTLPAGNLRLDFAWQIEASAEPPVPGAGLFVSSFGDNKIQRFDKNTTQALGSFVSGTVSGLNPSRLTFGPDGNLYIPNASTDEVLRYNGATGAFIDNFVAAGSGGLNRPKDLTFGFDGNLYVSSEGTNEVHRYNGATGAFIDVFVTAGSGGLTGASGLTFGPDGNLYLTSSTSAEVLRYNGVTGAFINAFVTAGSGGLVFPVDVRFGPDGNLYVASRNTEEVLRYNGATGAFIDAFVTSGSGGLDSPEAHRFGPDGHLYVSSLGTDEVLRYNGATGAFINAFTTSGSGGLNDPFGHVFGPDGNLYVASFGSDEVLRYNGATGAFINVFVSDPAVGLDQPTGVSFGPDYNLYVSNRGSGEVLRYDGATGAFIDAFVTAGSGGLDAPRELLFGPDGNLYVCSSSSEEVLRYNGATGAFIDAFVTAGSGGLDDPFDLVFGPDGNLYVSSRGSNEVLRYNGATGAFIDAFVTAGSGGISLPWGLEFGPDGNLYVCSRGTNEVLRYNGATGAFINVFVVAASGGLSGPQDLAFLPDGNLYVCSVGNDQVLRYNGATGAFIDVFASSSGGLDGPTYMTCGVAIPSGPPNDDCADAITITDGTTPYDTTTATTDGPSPCGGTVGSDIWFSYTAPCAGDVTVSTCGLVGFDTVIAIYPSGLCPPGAGDALACSDNTPGCGVTSEATAQVADGETVLIQVGGFAGEAGPGLVSVAIACAPIGTEFIRADCNADGPTNIADPVRILSLLFAGSGPVPCDDACDCNDDESLNIADAVCMLTALFGSPPFPVPPPAPACGLDPAGDLLGCNSFPSCP